jgi:deoxyribodipyrimidine photolyase-related protein
VADARLLPVLGDQLSHDLASLRDARPARDLVVMAEVAAEARYAPHHRQKIALIFAAMRHFRDELRSRGFTVRYFAWDDDDGPLDSLAEALARCADDGEYAGIRATHCGEWRLHRAMLDDWPAATGLDVDLVEDDRFVCSVDDFRRWAEGRKQPRMEYFYREMRRRTGLLLDADGKPLGGAWNFDADNRRRWAGEPPAPEHGAPSIDAVTQQVIDLVGRSFTDHPGTLDNFSWPVNRTQAMAALEEFVTERLPAFGDFQDAMANGEPYLFHALLSSSLNIGLLTPLEVCQRVEQAYLDGAVPINAAEGFIRQIIGWREYVRGIYWWQMPDYGQRRSSGRELPHYYWDGDTRMRCMREAIGSTLDNAYAHHIQRLMITGNFALLADLDLQAICDWYLGVYIDAFEWVELPNTLGMVMHADGGLMGSKPYAASGAYVNRMSDHCKACHYRVRETTGARACPFNALYWAYLDRNGSTLRDNPRMALAMRNWDRKDADERAAILDQAAKTLADLERL